GVIAQRFRSLQPSGPGVQEMKLEKRHGLRRQLTGAHPSPRAKPRRPGDPARRRPPVGISKLVRHLTGCRRFLSASGNRGPAPGAILTRDTFLERPTSFPVAVGTSLSPGVEGAFMVRCLLTSLVILGATGSLSADSR